MATTTGARFHLKSLFQQIENETHRENILWWSWCVVVKATTVDGEWQTAFQRIQHLFSSSSFHFCVVLNCTRSTILVHWCWGVCSVCSIFFSFFVSPRLFLRSQHCYCWLFHFGCVRSDNDLRVCEYERGRTQMCWCVIVQKRIAHRRPMFHRCSCRCYYYYYYFRFLFSCVSFRVFLLLLFGVFLFLPLVCLSCACFGFISTWMCSFFLHCICALIKRKNIKRLCRRTEHKFYVRVYRTTNDWALERHRRRRKKQRNERNKNVSVFFFVCWGCCFVAVLSPSHSRHGHILCTFHSVMSALMCSAPAWTNNDRCQCPINGRNKIHDEKVMRFGAQVKINIKMRGAFAWTHRGQRWNRFRCDSMWRKTPGMSLSTDA